MIVASPSAADIIDSGAFGQSLVRTATLLAGRTTIGLPVYIPSAYGTAGPAATSTQNRDTIQATVAAVVATGLPGRILIDTPGVWLVAGSSTGYLSTGKGCIGLSTLPAGSVFEIGAGVTLKLPNSSMSGSTLWYDMLIADAASLDITICGDGTIDMNSTNQASWTGGYTQLAGSKGVCVSCENGAFTRVHVKGLTIKNCFANPSLITGKAQTPRFGSTAIHERLKCENFGEGPEIDVVTYGFQLYNDLVFNDNVAGDLLEMVNCVYGTWVGNRWRHTSGTNPPTSGAAFDAGGTLYAYFYDNGGSDIRAVFEATTTNTVTGFTNRRNVYTYCNGLFARNCPGGAIFPGEGQSDWYGIDLLDCAVGINCRGNATFTDQYHRFYSPRITGTSTPFFIEGDTDVEIIAPYVVATGISIHTSRSSTNDGIPNVKVRGGKLSSSASSNLYIQANSYAGIFNPAVELNEVDCTYNSSAGVCQVADASSDASNVVYNRSKIDANSGKRGNVICSATFSGFVTGQTRIFKIPVGVRLIAEQVTYRVVDQSGAAGNVTMSVGTAAGSYVDIATSAAHALTTTGVRTTATLATTVAGPIGGTTAPGTDIYVDVTGAATGYLKISVEVIGRLVPVPVADSLASITGFRSLYRWPLGLWQDAGKTTPADAIDELVRVWSASQGTALDLVAPADATRMLFGQYGVKGNSLGYLTASINLAGPYTLVYQIRTGPSNSNVAYLSLAMGAGNLLIRNTDGPVTFYHTADAATTSFSQTANNLCVIGHSVTAGNVGSIFRSDGTKANADGSSGSSIQSATTTINIGANPAGANPIDGDRYIQKIAVFDADLSAANFLRALAAMEAM